MITGLKVSNFKSVKEFDLPLPSLTIIAGMNSSGKSSLIQAVLLVMQNYREIDSKVKGKISLKGELIDLGLSDSILYWGADIESLKIDFTYKNGSSSEISVDYEEGSNRLSFTRNKLSYNKLSSLNLRYAPALRTGPRQFYTKSGSKAGNYPNSLDAEGVISFIDVNRSVIVDSHMCSPGSSNNLASQINSWLSTVSPGFQIAISPAERLDITRVSFTNTKKGSLKYEAGPQNVGFGLSYVLPIISSLLSSKSGDLVILENPEAHIHPEGQLNLGDLISRAAAKNDRNIIVETHSDHIINAVRLAVKSGTLAPEDVMILNALLVNEGNYTFTQFEKINIDKQGKLSSWPTGFFDQYKNALIDLL